MTNASRRTKKGVRPRLKRAKASVGTGPYLPTDESKAQVQALCGFGLSEEAVANFLQIAPKTLRKHYSDQIRMARPTLMALASATLFHHLKEKDLSAAKYVHGCLGRKYGWSLDATPEPMTQINALQRMFADADFSKLSDEQFEKLVELLAIAGIEIPNPNAMAEAQPDQLLIGPSTSQ